MTEASPPTSPPSALERAATESIAPAAAGGPQLNPRGGRGYIPGRASGADPVEAAALQRG